MVFASLPLVSAIRLAALPVGAASTQEIFNSSKICRMAWITVVLPVPGPPVTTVKPEVTALRMASRCSGA